MKTSSPQPFAANPYQRIAAPLHLLLVLFLLAVSIYLGRIRADQLRAAVNPDHVNAYLRIILTEWIVLAVVLLGVWFSGSSLFSVLGEKWRSVGQLLRDLGIGVAFLFVSVLVVSVVGPLLGVSHDNRDVQFLLPHGSRETALWVCVALSAGICEEAVYRGYLQRQLTAFTRNAVLGILLAAVAFGLAHSYQGFRRAALITVGGTLSGILAHWRRSVRPGIFAHSLQDLLALIVRH